MTTAKRDQRRYDFVQKHLSDIIQNVILQIVQDLGDPYIVKPNLGGMTAYPPKAMAAICIIMEAERKTYRKMVGYLNNNLDLISEMGLLKVPSKSTIARSYRLIPEEYLMEVHRRIIRGITPESVAGDGTGYSDNCLVRWYDVRADKFKLRKGWVKLHSLVDIRTRTILDYHVTASNVADITGIQVMLSRFKGGFGYFCLDSAYLSRNMCNMIHGMGMIPRIKPKSNTVHNARGSQPWRDMVDLYMDDLDTFNSEYHQRSIIEAVFGALKKMYGNHIRCHNKENQKREIAMRIICYNVELVARTHVKNGRLAPELIAAITA